LLLAANLLVADDTGRPDAIQSSRLGADHGEEGPTTEMLCRPRHAPRQRRATLETAYAATLKADIDQTVADVIIGTTAGVHYAAEEKENSLS
jgi:hypothetical protein